MEWALLCRLEMFFRTRRKPLLHVAPIQNRCSTYRITVVHLQQYQICRACFQLFLTTQLRCTFSFCLPPGSLGHTHSRNCRNLVHLPRHTLRRQLNICFSAAAYMRTNLFAEKYREVLTWLSNGIWCLPDHYFSLRCTYVQLLCHTVVAFLESTRD